MDGKIVQLTDKEGNNIYPLTGVNSTLSVLFENAEGTNGTVTLAESAANYETLKIYFKNNDEAYSSVEVNDPDGKVVSLMSGFGFTANSKNYFNIKATDLSISGKTLTPVIGGDINFTSGSNVNISYTTNNNYIVKVEGMVRGLVPSVKYTLDNYSTEEKLIGTWTDGKPLYQKTIVFDHQVGTADTINLSAPHNIANINQIWLAEDSFVVTDQFPNEFHTLNFMAAATNYTTSAIERAFVDKTKVTIKFAPYLVNQVTSAHFYITLRYTKTTD